jgi:hypothetical protein
VFFTLHLAAAPDSTIARTLALTVLADVPHAESMLAALDNALMRPSEEYRVVVARNRSAVVGLVVFGARFALMFLRRQLAAS